MVLTIDGTDFVDYVAHGGYKWSRNDVENSDAGRDLSGTMHRDRVATKIRLDITCRPLTGAEISTLLTAIRPVYVTVQYTDPQVGGVVTKTMYSNNEPASYLMPSGNTDYWNGVTFPLIEV